MPTRTRKQRKQARRRKKTTAKRIKKEKGQNIHHVLPKALGGSNRDDNLVVLDKCFHDAYHRLAQEMCFEDFIDFMSVVMCGGTSWNSKELHDFRRHIIDNNGLFIVEGG